MALTCKVCERAGTECICKKHDVVNKLIMWHDTLSAYNLDLDEFPSLAHVLNDINCPYEKQLVRDYFDAVISQRSAEYWKATPVPIPENLKNRMQGLVMDLEGDGY